MRTKDPRSRAATNHMHACIQPNGKSPSHRPQTIIAQQFIHKEESVCSFGINQSENKKIRQARMDGGNNYAISNMVRRERGDVYFDKLGVNTTEVRYRYGCCMFEDGNISKLFFG